MAGKDNPSRFLPGSRAWDRLPFLDGPQLNQAFEKAEEERAADSPDEEIDCQTDSGGPIGGDSTVDRPATVDTAAVDVGAESDSRSDKGEVRVRTAMDELSEQAKGLRMTDAQSGGQGTNEPGSNVTSPPGQATEVRSEMKKAKKKKVLLMGKSGSGKSSMRSIIFSNYLAKDTRRLGATIDIDLSHVKFLGNLQLNLWDCGGQEAFMENYLSQQRMHVFSNVGVLIYVFDIESRDVDRDLATYVSIISALIQYSPTAKVFLLIHKMDLIQPTAREAVFDERVRLVRHKTPNYDLASPVALTPFATSIWDQSLYKAWASIIHDLVPNLSLIETDLGHLGALIEAEELMLFERTSFLVVSHWCSGEGGANPCEDRLERMSNVFKTFKSSLARFSGTPRNAEQFRYLMLKCSTRFSMFITKFTTNTYIFVVLPPGEARFNAAGINIQIAARQFEWLDSPIAAAGGAAGAKGNSSSSGAGGKEGAGSSSAASAA